MLSTLIVENFAETSLGIIEPLLKQKGEALFVCQPFAGDAVPEDADHFQRMIVLGGGQNALDDASSPYFPQLISLIRSFHDQGKPILGVCLGAQLIARAFDGTNVIDRDLEFGYLPVTPTANAQDDPVLSILTEPTPIFHWHRDTFTRPENAVHLASSAVTPNQAFRLGRATYGIQFHFEVSAEVINRWSDQFGHLLTGPVPDWPARCEAEIATHDARATEFGCSLTRRWLEL